jgi:hypothetical protein
MHDALSASLDSHAARMQPKEQPRDLTMAAHQA